MLVLEMGESIKIVDLARRLAAEVSPGTPPEIVYSGLGTAEKLHEALVSSQDAEMDRSHESLLRFAVPTLDPSLLVFPSDTADPSTWRASLASLVGIDHGAAEKASPVDAPDQEAAWDGAARQRDRTAGS